jgi:pyrimidine-nucleoside phosphorylase
MAIYFKGMTRDETLSLTLAMARSGDTVDLSGIAGVKADKHSTGGVGDKTTLVVVPVVAACGLKVAKMSGRGLGHTGGTVDKLMSIPGFRLEFTQEEFTRIVNAHGLCLAGQSGNLTPADKKLYALRDITGTVDSLPLIASSIMGKKLAAGADCILLDVKCGSGAFMRTRDDAVALAKCMVDIGEGAGKRTSALITDMDRPLGRTIGNALEVAEAVDVLKGRCEKGDLFEICMVLAAHMLYLAGAGTLAKCHIMAKETIADGTAFVKFTDMVAAQGGDVSVLLDTGKLPRAMFRHVITVPASGYIQSMDTLKWGAAAVMLGAGRERTEDLIDYGAGIVLHKKTGDAVRAGDMMAEFYTNDRNRLKDAEYLALSSIATGTARPNTKPLVMAHVDRDGVRVYFE